MAIDSAEVLMAEVLIDIFACFYTHFILQVLAIFNDASSTTFTTVTLYVINFLSNTVNA